MRPSAINNRSEHKVSPKIPKFHFRRNWSECGARNGEIGMIDENRSAYQRCKHDSPVRKRLARKVGKNNLCGHPSAYKGHDQGIEDEVIVFQNKGIGRSQPGQTAAYEYDDGGPFEEQWRKGQSLCSTCTCYVDDAGRQMRNEERY